MRRQHFFHYTTFMANSPIQTSGIVPERARRSDFMFMWSFFLYIRSTDSMGVNDDGVLTLRFPWFIRIPLKATFWNWITYHSSLDWRLYSKFLFLTFRYSIRGVFISMELAVFFSKWFSEFYCFQWGRICVCLLCLNRVRIMF